MRNNLSRTVLLIVLLGLTNTVAAQATRVAVGYSGISADQLVIWIARDAGIFAKNNLDVQAVYFSGGTISVTAMIAGDTPIIQASGPGIVSAGLAGADPVYVVGGITTLDYWLMTQPEIKTPEQLKGGTVAVARFGGAAVEAVEQGKWGHMVALQSPHIVTIPFVEALAEPRRVDPNHDTVRTARATGISFGD